jgi:riboflavin kinase/FMN adenylyltransferase
MKILRSYNNEAPELEGAVMAIGNFDGVHKAHQKLLRTVIEKAHKLSAPSGVIVFEPHPRQFFSPEKPFFRLTPLEVKLALLHVLGLDMVSVVDFNSKLVGLSAEEFVRHILVDGLHVGHVVIGFDFYFGKGRNGSPDAMREFGESYGFGVSVMEEITGDGAGYSSSRVRALLRDGDPREAAQILGHWWRVSGKVKGGAGRGHGLGYPTANIRLQQGQIMRHGIYAVRVYIDDMSFDGAAYLGTRPTFDNGAPELEAFIFDFEGDLYEKEIEVEIIDYIRGDEKFSSPAELQQQMDVDCATARGILKNLDETGLLTYSISSRTMNQLDE